MSAARLLHLWQKFVRDRAGTFLPVVAIATPAIFALAGAGLDLARVAKARSQLQTAADGGALAGASSLRMSNTNSTTAGSVSEAQTRSSAPSLDNLVVASSVTTGDVQVTATGDVPTSLMKMFGRQLVRIEARARARVIGSTPTCIMILDPSAASAFDVDSANLSAGGCAAFSNSTASDSMSLDKGAVLATAFACSSGGLSAKGGASATPAPQIDCPPRPDPLLDRTQPTIGACTATDLKITTSTVLVPGTYCGGIELKDNASVTLQAGTYVIKDGKLKTNKKGTVTGSGVTLFFTGTQALLDVSDDASLDLNAPAFGAMAGILMFEDRSVQLGQSHKLNSRDAPNLLGTVYLSRSTLEIGAKGGYASTSVGMAQSSAWTVIVVRKLSINDKINLVLNTNFGTTPVKPPASVAPAAQVRLIQ